MPEEPEADLEEGEEASGPPPGPGRPLLGPAPRFRTSARRPTPPAPAPAGEDSPAGEAPLTPPPPLGTPDEPKATGSSSRGSTDEDVVDIKDLTAAAKQFADVAFVDVAQAFGYLEKRAKGYPGIDPKWVPSKAERAMVSEPTARIFKRHMHADVVAMDTIDGLLIAVGVGHFVTRNALNIDPLEEDK